MTTPRVLGAIALADFLERVRRPAFVMILIAAVALGYFSAPPGMSQWMMFRMGEYRGVYTSEYLGAVTALAAGAWLALGGFYFVKNTIARDESTGVGQILAGTPLRNSAYVLGKFLSNMMVLVAMAAVLAVTALGVQVLRGESSSIDLVALWMPFLVLTVPMLAISAAAAVLFETIRPLRAGLGNIVWFFVWLAVFGVGTAGVTAFDLLGFSAVEPVMQRDIAAQFGTAGDTELSIGLNVSEAPPGRFIASGIDTSAGILISRVGFVLLAILLVLAAALWFRRFDTSRSAGKSSALPEDLPQTEATPVPAAAGALGRANRPTAPVERGGTALRLFVGETRVLLQGVSHWWWLIMLAAIIVGAVVPLDILVAAMLPAVWILPVVIWSRMGTQQYEHDVRLLVASCPSRRTRLAAEWTAGLALTIIVGLVPAVRMGIAADWPGVLAWLGGLVFIPSLALALGLIVRSHRLFQIVYLLLWYTVASRTPTFDYMGAVRTDGQLAGPNPLVFAGIAAVLLIAAYTTGETRHARR